MGATSKRTTAVDRARCYETGAYGAITKGPSTDSAKLGSSTSVWVVSWSRTIMARSSDVAVRATARWDDELDGTVTVPDSSPEREQCCGGLATRPF